MDGVAEGESLSKKKTSSALFRPRPVGALDLGGSGEELRLRVLEGIAPLRVEGFE